MGCGFSNEKPESNRNLRNKDITNILDDTQRSNFLYLISASKCISITTKEYEDSSFIIQITFVKRRITLQHINHHCKIFLNQ